MGQSSREPRWGLRLSNHCSVAHTTQRSCATLRKEMNHKLFTFHARGSSSKAHKPDSHLSESTGGLSLRGFSSLCCSAALPSLPFFDFLLRLLLNKEGFFPSNPGRSLSERLWH